MSAYELEQQHRANTHLTVHVHCAIELAVDGWVRTTHLWCSTTISKCLRNKVRTARCTRLIHASLMQHHHSAARTLHAVMPNVR